jgi:murein DD-endopeptidase MepM/ murein hydrolase activator NlpD
MRPLDAPPLRGPWHLAPNPYSARYIPGSSPPRLYERARLGCLPGDAGHGGSDIDAGSNDLILRAVWAGRVHRYAWDDFGNHLGIVRDDGTEAFYAHLAAFHVADGQLVAADQDLGIMGRTGNATGVHCHFELRARAGDWCSAIDPAAYLEDTVNLTPQNLDQIADAVVGKIWDKIMQDPTHPNTLINIKADTLAIRKKVGA